MIRFVPCRISSVLHVTGQRITRPEATQMVDAKRGMHADQMPGQKCARVMTAKGRVKLLDRGIQQVRAC
jgi:hypothetical protein